MHLLMSRTSQAIDDPGSASPRHALASLRGKFVCPFCGSIKDSAEKPCPRCTMADTPQTRQATRSRIGPWYVLQTRNPSAPGMKYETLLALVQRGQVTPRSIVRGPTTHQLWRFAAKVKGLSREFGLCYHCEAEIDRKANICPHCQKIQEPPPNPDVLLESRPGPFAGTIEPIRREAQAASRVENRPSSNETSAAATDDLSSPASPPAEPPLVAPEDQATERSYAALAVTDAPSHAAPAASAEPRRKTGQEILSARELAAAFRLELQPPASSVRQITSRRRWRWIVLSLLVLIIVAGGTLGVMLAIDPSLRGELRQWVQQTFEKTFTARQVQSPAPEPGENLWQQPAPPSDPEQTEPLRSTPRPTPPARQAVQPQQTNVAPPTSSTQSPATSAVPSAGRAEPRETQDEPTLPRLAPLTRVQPPNRPESASPPRVEPSATRHEPSETRMTSPAPREQQPTARVEPSASNREPSTTRAEPASTRVEISAARTEPATAGSESASEHIESPAAARIAPARPAEDASAALAPPARPARPQVPAPQAAPASNVSENPIQVARRLRVQALDAEADEQYDRARQLYEQIIQTLPRESWPSDVELRLAIVKQLQQQAR